MKVRAQIGVVGAGLAGLTAANELTRAGFDVVVLEKSRGPGGRMATRRDGDDRFDHGAQYFTVRSPEFAQRVAQWEQQRVVQRWAGRVVAVDGVGATTKPADYERYVGVPGMSAICRMLSEGIDVRLRCRVTELVREQRWLVNTDSQQRFEFDQLLLTAPPQQCAELIEFQSQSLAQRLHDVQMMPCWALMLCFDEPLKLSFDAAFVNEHPVLSWVARNTSKPGRPDSECWVIHASEAWSIVNLEQTQQSVDSAIMSAFLELFGLSQKPRKQLAHRWRYARAAAPIDSGFLSDSAKALTVAGDWCGGSRVEGAFLSGSQAAEHISRQLIR